MNKISVEIPPSLEHYEEFFRMFIEGMLVKLHRNAHKKTPTVNTVPEILILLQEEIAEFEDGFYDGEFGDETLVELMDVANFAFLAYLALRFKEVHHDRRNQSV